MATCYIALINTVITAFNFFHIKEAKAVYSATNCDCDLQLHRLLNYGDLKYKSKRVNIYHVSVLNKATLNFSYYTRQQNRNIYELLLRDVAVQSKMLIFTERKTHSVIGYSG